MNDMEETGTGHGIKIRHEWLGRCQVIEAHYNETGEHRLDLVMDGRNVYLTEQETAYFLAWMSTWYGQGNSVEKQPCSAK